MVSHQEGCRNCYSPVGKIGHFLFFLFNVVVVTVLDHVVFVFVVWRHDEIKNQLSGDGDAF